ncbi:MAG: ACT domain-containing protein, partial [Halobaculum sp.]
YVASEDAEEAEATLHDEVVGDESLSSVTNESDFAVVRVMGGELPNQPGVINEIVAPVSDAGVTIHDLVTSATSVAIFVDWDDREDVLSIVQDRV